MKRLLTTIFLIIFISSCIHRQDIVTIKQPCEKLLGYDNLKIRAKTRLETSKDKFTIIQNIYIKNGMVRVDVMGVFDDIVTTIIVKDKKLYVMDYHQRIIYTFTNENELYNLFNIAIPFTTLPTLLTLSVEEKTLVENDNNTFLYSDNNGDKIEFSVEPEHCTVKKVEIYSANNRNISATYSDFSTVQGKRIFHQIRIQDEKKSIKTEIKFLKISLEEIDKEIFEISSFRDFKNAIK